MKLILSLFISAISITNIFAQNNPNVLNGYKYAIVQVLTYNNGNIDHWGISNKVMSAIEQKGIKLFKSDDEINRVNPPSNEIFWVFINHSNICEGCGAKKVNLIFKNYEDKIIYKSKGSGLCLVGLQCEVDKATKRALSGIYNLNYKFTPSLTPKIVYPKVENTYETEESLKKYFSSNKLKPIEGIYKAYQSKKSGYYKIAIKKYDNIYKAIILESEFVHWNLGEVKATFESSSMKGFYSTKWYMSNKTEFQTFATMENGVLLTIEFNNPKTNEKDYGKFIKLYPPVEGDIISNEIIKSSGSGFFLTANGIIATNAHVIKNAKTLNIQMSNEIGNFDYSAKVLLVDSKNDVALIKIDDENFKGLPTIPYSFIEKAEIGEKAFTIGFPLNDVMGTNYKVTDGIISSTSGINDDIRYFQISVPLQPGNSGGPLFNDNGDVIGITSARLNSEAVGTNIENVNYAIKVSYLMNLYNMLPNNDKLNTKTLPTNKELYEHVKILKNYVCLINVN